MADREQIIKALKENKFTMTSILIDDFGYSVHEVLDINENTKDTDTIIIAYSTSYDHWNNEVVADTHFIRLNDLLGADTVILGEDRPITVIH